MNDATSMPSLLVGTVCKRRTKKVDMFIAVKITSEGKSDDSALYYSRVDTRRQDRIFAR